MELAKLPVVRDDTLPLIWIDNVLITARADIPIVTLVCTSVIDGRQVEQVKVNTSIQHLERMGDAFTKLAARFREAMLEHLKAQQGSGAGQAPKSAK